MTHQTVQRPGTDTTSAAPRSLPALLDEWVGEGLVSADQAARIRAREAARPAPRTTPRQSFALEAVGYVGGVIVVVTAILLGARFWDQLGQSARLGLVGGAALTLILGGVLVPDRVGDAGTRLRSVLWLAATGTFAGFLAVLGSEVLDLSADDLALVVTGGATLLAAALWLLRPSMVQQLAVMVGLILTAGVAVADVSASDVLPGVGAWCVAAAWAVLAWGDLVPHRRLGLGVGAAGMIVASLTTIPSDPGIVLALATVAAVVLAAVLFHDLVLLVIGAVGTLNVLPAAISVWFPDTVAAPLALLMVGLALVAMALWGARRGKAARPTSAGHDWSSGSRRAALSTVFLLLGVVVVLVVAG